MSRLAPTFIETLPVGALPPSAAIDALHMAAGIKPAMRTRMLELGATEAVARWCERHGLSHLADEEGYVCVAVERSLAALVLEVDRQVDAHEARLGQLLGYPPCCCELVATWGEDRIDLLVAEAARWQYVGEYRLINPARYLTGESLVCHLPCSPRCDRTLELARAALGLLRTHAHSAAFKRWNSWLNVDWDSEFCRTEPIVRQAE